MRKGKIANNLAKKPLGIKGKPATSNQEPSVHNTATAGEFKGFKINSSSSAGNSRPAIKGAGIGGVKPRNIQGFGDDVAKDTVGAKMLIVDAQEGNTILGEGEKDSSTPLVIPVKRNANWMEKTKGNKSTKTGDSASNPQVLSNVSASGNESYGLQLPTRAAARDKDTRQQEPAGSVPNTRDALSIRQEAINELTSGSRNLVITPQSERERQAYENDVGEYSDNEADEEAYERVPIEEFGLAMLRGMGWKEEDKDARNSEIVENAARPSLLGLGAKPLSDLLPSEHKQRRIKRF